MRCFGILLPIYELPGKAGIGDFGDNAYRFVDKLAAVGGKIWQILPLNPLGYGNSPYQPLSSMAGETLFISLDLLYREGLLKKKPAAFSPRASVVDYPAVRAFKAPYLKEAAENFKKTEDYARGYRRFIRQDWVCHYAVFRALRKQNGERSWMEWPEEERDWIVDGKYDISHLQEQIEEEMILQYLFFKQWKALKAYANVRGIKIMGDMPFYVGQDSLDVWGNRDKFLLDPDGYATAVAGVPPDYFSEDGQYWGNPIFNWKAIEKEDFRFYIDRIKACEKMYDILRIDHFRAFDTYWQIPATSKTAAVGEWVLGPAYRFFDTFLPQAGKLKIVAEDLGDMRPEVYELRDHYAFPGMAVMEFLLADSNREKLVKKNSIAYTGTHDNDTVVSWWNLLTEEERAVHKAILVQEGYRPKKSNIAKIMCHLTLNTPSDTAILPVQDILGLPHEARINEPSTVKPENWSWKMKDFRRFDAALPGLKELVRESGRYRKPRTV